MKRVIVTGANGFLGTALIKKLSSIDVEIYAIIRDQSSDIRQIKNLPNVHIVYCNLYEISKITYLVTERGFDCFFHLAWSGTSGDARANIELQLKNVDAACKAVEAAERLGCAKFIYAGSIMEYEVQQYALLDGSTPNYGSIYSSAKLTADIMAKTLAIKLGINYICALISNVYGPGEQSTRFLNFMLHKMLKGETISLTEGNQLYDFIYIDDAVSAIVEVAQNDIFQNESVYIGNKRQRPLKEFVLEMRETVGGNSELRFGAIPFHGRSLTYKEFDTAKLEDKLHFIPLVSFPEGIRRTCIRVKDGQQSRNMNFELQKTEFNEVFIIKPFYVEDQRGFFLKSIERDIFRNFGLNVDIQEEFESFSKMNVIRGLHFQTKNPQIKIVRVIQGEILDVIVDIRRNSPTYGKYISFLLSDKNPYSLWIPAGFAHGFRVISEEGATMSYKCIGKYEKNFDAGIIWNDPDLKIAWGIEKPIVSERDMKHPSFKEFHAQMGGLDNEMKNERKA